MGGKAAIINFWDKITSWVNRKIVKDAVTKHKNDKGHLLFLSLYAAQDSENARELARQLREAGMNIWLDIDDLKPGDLWQARLEEALQAATAFLVYVGESGVKGWIDCGKSSFCTFSECKRKRFSYYTCFRAWFK